MKNVLVRYTNDEGDQVSLDVEFNDNAMLDLIDLVDNADGDDEYRRGEAFL